MSTENSLEKQYLLTPDIKISSVELDLLKSALLKGISNNSEVPLSDIAVLLLANLQDAIKNKVNSRNIDFDLNQSLPTSEKDDFKAAIIKGMFITFLENEHSLPGFLKICGGIGATSFGIGSLKFSSLKTSLSKNEMIIPDLIKDEVKKYQITHLQKCISENYVTDFSDIRRGLLCALLSGALIPIYLMAICKVENISSPTEHQVQKAQEIVLQKFNSGSPGVTKLFSQSLFATMFDTLFSHSSTVHSIFSN